MKSNRSIKTTIIAAIASAVLLFAGNITADQVGEHVRKEADVREIELNIGLSDNDRSISADILNKILSSEFVLLVQTLNYHWNLVGPQFYDYHKLFDEQYKAIFEKIDEIAERVRAVGGVAMGSMVEMLHKSALQEDTDNVPDPVTMVSNLLNQHESLIRLIRGGINSTANNGDAGSSNFLTDLIEKHEKMAWMLRSLLERRKN